MKSLVNGIPIINPAFTWPKVRTKDLFPNHGILIGYEVYRNTDGSYSFLVSWQLKDLESFTYNYGGLTVEQCNRIAEAFNYTTPIRGLLGGEYYNRLLRSKLVSKVPF
jgi:hypothetical protein